MEIDYIMEKVNERRRFVKGIGFFAALLGGSGALSTTKSLSNASSTLADIDTDDIDSGGVSEPVVEDISHLAPPDGATTLQINGDYGEKPEPVAVPGIGGSTYYFNPMSNPVTTHSVAMTVGLDNRLWIKIGDTWKRVAVEQ